MNTPIKDQVVFAQLVMKHIPFGVEKAVTSGRLWLIPEIAQYAQHRDKVVVQLSGLYKNKNTGVCRISIADNSGCRYAYYRMTPGSSCEKKAEPVKSVEPEKHILVEKPNIQVFAKDDKIVIDLPSFTVTVNLK